MRHERTRPAERDIRDILRQTLRMFGPHQARAYAGIIERGIALIAEDPRRPSSFDRGELASGVRMLHLDIAAGRRGGAAHCVYYREGRLPDGTHGVVILRVLHEHMEPRHRVVRSVSDR